MHDKDVVRSLFVGFLARSWWVWCALIAAYAVIAATLPPTDDEVYYWSWSKSLQLSYYDHPGMTAWLIWLSTRLFGDTILGMRFPACCCVALTLAVIAHLTPPSPPIASAGPLRKLAESVGIHPLMFGLALTPLFTFGGILITPDAPLIACWALHLLWLVELHEALAEQRATWMHWLIGGVLLGLGGLSKYTMILAVPAGFASFALSGISWRKWLAGYVGHGLVAMCVASPILLYNVQHQFEPLLFQWRHAMHDEPATAVTFLEFFGVQLVLFGTLPFFIVPWMLRRLLSFSPHSPGGRGAGGEGDVTDVTALKYAASMTSPSSGRNGHLLPPGEKDNALILARSPHLRVCSFLFLVPLAFFVYKAARTELEGNWGLVAFLSVWPIVAAWYATVENSRTWRWLTAAGFLMPAICVMLLAIHILSPLPLIGPEHDRLSKFRGRWQMVQQLADAIHQQDESIPTFHHTYQLTALLRYHGIDARQEGTTRPSHFTFPPQQVASFPAAYLVTEPLATPPEVDGMATPELLGTFPTVARGTTVHEYQLWRYETKTEITDLRSQHVEELR